MEDSLIVEIERGKCLFPVVHITIEKNLSIFGIADLQQTMGSCFRQDADTSLQTISLTYSGS